MEKLEYYCHHCGKLWHPVEVPSDCTRCGSNRLINITVPHVDIPGESYWVVSVPTVRFKLTGSVPGEPVVVGLVRAATGVEAERLVHEDSSYDDKFTVYPTDDPPFSALNRERLIGMVRSPFLTGENIRELIQIIIEMGQGVE